MRRAVFVLLAFGLVSPGPLTAADKGCEIEDLKHSYNEIVQGISLQGVATCAHGVAHFRLYDGEGASRKFLGVATAHIRGYIFTTFALGTGRPQALSFKYTVEARR